MENKQEKKQFLGESVNREEVNDQLKTKNVFQGKDPTDGELNR